VAAAAAWLSLRCEAPAAPTPPAATGGDATRTRTPLARAVLGIALASGATSFAYEIGWIRLLNQALGTTLHSFELMLAAFLTGLALGGLWVHRRGRHLADPLRPAALAQVAMGIAALLSLLAFAHSFDWTAALVQAL